MKNPQQSGYLKMGSSTTRPSGEGSGLSPKRMLQIRTMWIFGHYCLALGLCFACSQAKDPPPGIETMSLILETMIRQNQTILKADSLSAKRRALFERFGTSDREIHDWIEAMRQDVTRSRELAERMAEAIGKDSGPKPPIYGESRRSGQKD